MLLGGAPLSIIREGGMNWNDIIILLKECISVDCLQFSGLLSMGDASMPVQIGLCTPLLPNEPGQKNSKGGHKKC